jgi:hypothetical protein
MSEDISAEMSEDFSAQMPQNFPSQVLLQIETGFSWNSLAFWFCVTFGVVILMGSAS